MSAERDAATAVRTEYEFDVTDAVSGESYSIHRCLGCMALVQSEHVADHLHWHRTASAQVLLRAADWFEKDDDNGGPAYHAPNGHPYYEAEFWAAGHLRALADRQEP